MIDKFIQDCNKTLGWFPYDVFKNVKYLDKGGFSTIYEAIWLDGPIKGWYNDEQKLIRQNNKMVVIKSLNESSSLCDEFLNEV